MDLISKKELLAVTGISYGQLYRWKRERLIPEEWFIKQSSFTGQETFFPKEQILERVKSIVQMKDSHSLEEVAGILSSQEQMPLRREDVAGIEGILPRAAALLAQLLDKEEFTINELALVNEICRYADSEGLPYENFHQAIRGGAALFTEVQPAELICTIFCAGGEYHLCFTRGAQHPQFDRGVCVCASIALGEKINYLKTQLSGAIAANDKER